MGKPTNPKAGFGTAPSAASGSSGYPRDTSDAVSLHTNPGTSSFAPFRDNDDDDDTLQLAPGLDDLPPSYSDSYTDTPADINTASGDTGYAHTPSPPYDFFRIDPATFATYYIESSFDDPKILEQQILALAKMPPRPYVHIRGTHTRVVRDSKGKTERKTIIDFDIKIDLTPYLFRNAARGEAWTEICTPENWSKVHRGTILKKTAPGARAGISLEDGGGPKPELREWCHRFCASSAGLKHFSLHREFIGFDSLYVKHEISRLIHETNYKGNLSVSVVNSHHKAELYNEAKINRWRLTPWIWWLFTLTFLWIFTWPYLFFRTKKWEVVSAQWSFSRFTHPDSRSPQDSAKEYVSLSEQQWYNMWARAIRRAALEKRQGTLTQYDLREEEGRGEEPTFNSGNDTVDAIFRAGMGAMNVVNRQLGWGHDEE